jgi:hypothetical protein
MDFLDFGVFHKILEVDRDTVACITNYKESISNG